MSEFNNLEDLVFSRSFRSWVLNRDSPEHAFWENWVQRNPEKAEIVKNAKAMIFALQLNTPVLSADEIDEEARKALNRLKEAPRYIPLEGVDGRGGRWRGILRPTGLVLMVLLAAAMGAVAVFYYRAPIHRDLLQDFRNRHKQVQEQAADADGEFRLPDGSLVRLTKGSKLYFPVDWKADRAWREVFLQGQARFDIRRNPAKPFYVYTDQVICKVLGTSFVMSTYPADGRAIIGVVSGTVSVYRAEDYFARPAGKNELAGVVVTANQEVIYDQNEGLRKTLCAMPVPLGGLDTLVVYQQTPIRQVFTHLQEEFGIPIQFDEAALDSCLLTAVVEAEPYYKKLDQICKAIGGAYEVIDGNIVVSAVGCR